MRIRWVVVALVLSVLLNAGLAFLVLIQAIDSGHYQSDQQSSWRYIVAERRELQAMRAQFCEASPNPTRAELVEWATDTQSQGEPYEKDGLLWLENSGIKLDDGQRLVGVCSYMAWQTLDDPTGAELDDAGNECPLEPLC